MISCVMEDVLIVGAGITGAVTASMLRGQLPSSTRITLWDKAHGAGGRMSTSRAAPHINCANVDLGAQYISATPANFHAHKGLYEELLSQKVLEPLSASIEGDRSSADTKHFVTPDGVSSLVKHFLGKSGADLRCGHLLRDIQLKHNRWSVTADGNPPAEFDCVVLTMPVPQILQLTGTIRDLTEQQFDIKQKLQDVTYSSRFALGMFYKRGTQIDVPWAARYIFDDPCVRFVSVDNKKRARVSPDVGPSVCVHTSVPFSLEHLEEDKEAVCKELVLPCALKLVPELPAPDDIKCNKWRYSQVFKAYQGKPGAVVLQDSPLLVLAGDGFVNSGFDNCIESATKVVEHIVCYNGKISKTEKV